MNNLQLAYILETKFIPLKKRHDLFCNDFLELFAFFCENSAYMFFFFFKYLDLM